MVKFTTLADDNTLKYNFQFYILTFFFEECDEHQYGLMCNQTCGSCYGGRQCDHVNGSCTDGCEAGLSGENCDEGWKTTLL